MCVRAFSLSPTICVTASLAQSFLPFLRASGDDGAMSNLSGLKGGKGKKEAFVGVKEV